ncbi:uncharacterized protein EDB91DRAFT_1240213 [Suillus paluster]|uniref:uncharacterized protein n=1 Tax=Suillus paluster TaxID=48578 RepID=UPI001B869F6C|nr:uncharacterized protein EDB91DRAFT_1240213 [Suillus paluster]KAG1722490.1 hypothetical protein EDB91DRAFT_1240213 [Suillus paluster]
METQNFVKEHATHYTQLACLPYFDLVEQIVINPMHNLFLGLVKTHFYNIWVQNKILQPNHEVTKFHEMIADFVIPSSCSKLPTDIGMPSGGSLTADQWLLLSTVYGPIIIPQLWSVCLPTDASTEVLHQRLETDKQVQASHTADNCKSLAAAKKQGTDAFAHKKAQIAQEKLTAAEAKKTAKLKAAAAKEAEKVKAAAEKKAHNAQKLYGSAAIKPNHHYATHITNCVRNFGPLHNFWTFLFE